LSIASTVDEHHAQLIDIFVVGSGHRQP